MANRYSGKVMVGVKLRPINPKVSPVTYAATCRVAVPPQLSPTGKTLLEVIEFDFQPDPKLLTVQLPDVAAHEALGILSDEVESGEATGLAKEIAAAAQFGAVPDSFAVAGRRTFHHHVGAEFYVGEDFVVGRNPNKTREFVRSLSAAPQSSCPGCLGGKSVPVVSAEGSSDCLICLGAGEIESSLIGRS